MKIGKINTIINQENKKLAIEKAKNTKETAIKFIRKYTAETELLLWCLMIISTIYFTVNFVNDLYYLLSNIIIEGDHIILITSPKLSFDISFETALNLIILILLDFVLFSLIIELKNDRIVRYILDDLLDEINKQQDENDEKLKNIDNQQRETKE